MEKAVQYRGFAVTRDRHELGIYNGDKLIASIPIDERHRSGNGSKSLQQTVNELSDTIDARLRRLGYK